MNKQVILAGVLGAAAAQTCDDAFTKAATADKDAIKKLSDAAGLLTAGLKTAQEGTAALLKTADERVAAQKLIFDPFQKEYTTAKTRYEKETSAEAAASAKIGPIEKEITKYEGTKKIAEAAVKGQQAKIDAQKLLVTELTKAKTDHEAEKVTLNAAYLTAQKAESDANGVLATAKSSKETLEGLVAGLAKTEKDTKEAYEKLTGEKGVIKTSSAYKDSITAYLSAYEANEINVRLKAMLNTFCNAACAADALDPLAIMKKTQDDVKEAVTAKKGLMDTETKKYTDKWYAESKAKATYEVAKDADKLNDDAVAAAVKQYGLDDATVKAKVKLTAAAKAAEANVDLEIKQTVTDLARGNLLLANLNTALTPLTGAVSVEEYLLKQQQDALKVQNDAKTAAKARQVEFKGLQDMANESVVRAQAQLTFLQGLAAVAKTNDDQNAGLVTANKGKIDGWKLAMDALDLQIAAAVTDCKLAGYAQAQKALKTENDKKIADAAAAAKVKTDYDLKAAFAKTGETNTICSFPKKAKDAAQEPRAVCKDGFCCGAAQKFLRDGTKLAIETCQKATGVHTYQYFPPLPPSATVEPTPETWRFQCISGAQKLVATATAALAASYMMA